MPQKCLLLLDSYGGQNDDNMYKDIDQKVNSNKKLERLIIPKKTTSKLQPLDVGFFRILKIIKNQIQDHINLENIDISLKKRSNIITLWSLIFNQLSAEKFKNTLKNAWSDSGLGNEKYETINIQQSLFNISNDICYYCNDFSFICCSHCNKCICFNDFFNNYHFHN